MCLLEISMEGKYAALDTDGTQLLTYVTVGLAYKGTLKIHTGPDIVQVCYLSRRVLSTSLITDRDYRINR